MSAPPFRVAVVGLGFMGAAHVSAWYKVAGAELAAVVSGDPAKLQGDLSHIGGGNLGGEPARFDFTQMERYSHLAEALADPKIDAVDLCLPTHLHAEACLSALRAGKHVLVEKPLARTSSEAYALVDQSVSSGRVLMTGHVLRFIEEYRILADKLQHSPAHSAFFFRICGTPSWSTWLTDTALSGGAALDLLIHDADFVLHSFGQPVSISALGDRNWLTARMTFRDGAQAEIKGGWHANPNHPFSMGFHVTTQDATLEWSSGGQNLMPDPWVAQLQHFTDSALKNIVPEQCPPTVSARAVRLIEIILESSQKNGMPQPWTDFTNPA